MRLKYIGTNFKSYETLYGSLKFTRAIMRPEADEDMKRFQELVGAGRTTYHPMDALLGVEKMPLLMSAGLMSSIVYDLLNSPADVSLKKAAMKKYAKDSSLSQPERMVAYAGECAYLNQIRAAKRAAAPQSIKAEGQTAERTPCKDQRADQNPKYGKNAVSSGRLYLYMGQAFRNVFHEGKMTGESDRIPCHYAAAFGEDDIEYLRGREREIRGFKIKRRDMVAFLEDEEDAHLFVRALALRNGYGCVLQTGNTNDRRTGKYHRESGVNEKYPELVVISDGSEWIEELCRLAFAKEPVMSGSLAGTCQKPVRKDSTGETGAFSTETVIILDRERFMEDAEKYLRFHLPDSTRAEEHLSRLTDALDKGDGHAALKILEPYRFVKRPEGVPDAYGILRANLNHINYPKYRKMGIYPGTGIRDCSDRRLSKIPESLSGGVSYKENARGLLALISLKESGRWDELAPMLEEGV